MIYQSHHGVGSVDTEEESAGVDVWSRVFGGPDGN